MNHFLNSSKPRFRWVTLHRAFDVLVAETNFTNAKAISLIEEIGCGPELDQLSSSEKTIHKLKNFLSRMCREEPMRSDTEGTPLSDRIVREAAAFVPKLNSDGIWGSGPVEYFPVVRSFLNSLAVDGWAVEDCLLVPRTPLDIEVPRTRMRRTLEQLAANEALQRLEQLEKGLDEGHWESANGDTRGFFNSVFDRIAELHPDSKGQGLTEGKARSRLQEVMFFKPDKTDTRKSHEGKFVQSLSSLLGSEGAHSGLSDSDSAVFRYAIAIFTADYFLERTKNLNPYK